MDSENRVVRLDSFSKIVSAGLRLGFVTGPTKILDKMVLYIESSSIHPSNVSQVCIITLSRYIKKGFISTKTPFERILVFNSLVPFSHSVKITSFNH